MVSGRSLDESNLTGRDDPSVISWMIYLEINVMNKCTKDVIGVDVSNYDLESSTVSGALSSMYGGDPIFTSIVDSLNLQFGSSFSANLLRFHARAGTMSNPLYDHLLDLVSKDTRPICTVLVQFMKIGGSESADLKTCLRLLAEFDYVQMQVVNKYVNKLLLRTQQLLRLKSVDQVKKFAAAYNLFLKRKVVQEEFMRSAGSYLSRIQSSGLHSGCLN